MRHDAPEVPDQRRAELRPDLVGRGIGQHPGEQPGPAEMQDGVERGGGDGGQRRGLREAVHRRAQPVPAQHQDGGEEARRIGDANPPDVVDQVEAPDEGHVGAPEPCADQQQCDHGVAEQQHAEHRGAEAKREAPAEACLQRDGGDRVRARRIARRGAALGQGTARRGAQRGGRPAERQRARQRGDPAQRGRHAPSSAAGRNRAR
jgi:hypothetical protein